MRVLKWPGVNQRGTRRVDRQAKSGVATVTSGATSPYWGLALTGRDTSRRALGN